MTFSITARCEKTGMLGVDEHNDPVKELIRVYEKCQENLFPYTFNLVRRKEGSKA